MFLRRLFGPAVPASVGMVFRHREETGTPLTEEWAYLKALSHSVDSGLQRRPTGYWGAPYCGPSFVTGKVQ